MLKTIYDTKEEIPEGFDALYTEKGGKWELTGVVGVKTQADVDRVGEALRKEKEDHKKVKETLKTFEGIDPEEHHTLATTLEETKAQLEAVKKDGTFDETKLEPLIQARVKQFVAPIERDKASIQKQLEAKNVALAAAEAEKATLQQTIVTGQLERTIRDAAVAAKVLPTAVSDAVMRGTRQFELTEDGRVISKDGYGITPGLTPAEWFKDEQEKSPHWWPPSVGGGSHGSGKSGSGGTYAGANNPWSKDGWSMTKQGAVIKALGPDKAAEVAAMAGCKIGDTKPKAA
jgi:hypothetical protein